MLKTAFLAEVTVVLVPLPPAMPELGPELRLGLPELTTFVGLGSLCLAAAFRLVPLANLVPSNDPRLSEALAFHNA